MTNVYKKSYNLLSMKTEFKEIKKLVSGTPLVEIDCLFRGQKHKVFAKCEWYSLTGSIKDKVAYQIFKDAYETGKLKPHQKVVEVSSGNMGISISAIANLTQNPTTILMPKTMSEERKKLIRQFGATLVETENFPEAFALCKQYEKDGYFCPSQFENESNKKAHRNITAKEIFEKLKGKKVDAFVAGVGTSGTLCGIGAFLKEKMNLSVCAIEPQNARILSGKKPYLHHKLQGLSDEIVPKLYDKTIVNKIVQITDDDAIAMSQKLCKELSIGVGISSGANFLGAILSGKNCVTVLPDDNKKYLSTDLSIPTKTKLVDEIELIKIKYL